MQDINEQHTFFSKYFFVIKTTKNSFIINTSVRNKTYKMKDFQLSKSHFFAFPNTFYRYEVSVHSICFDHILGIAPEIEDSYLFLLLFYSSYNVICISSFCQHNQILLQSLVWALVAPMLCQEINSFSIEPLHLGHSNFIKSYVALQDILPNPNQNRRTLFD